jgi:hypothetical protein
VTNLASDIILLSIAYALLGVLLLVVCIFAKVPWPVKAGLIVLTSAFYAVSFFATRGLLGWSSTDPLPPKFKLLSARIVEPHSLEGDPGAIHLWVEALDDDNFPSGVPRAYRLPYDSRLAEKTEAAVRASADGKPQGVGQLILATARAAWGRRPSARSRPQRLQRLEAATRLPAVPSTLSLRTARIRRSILLRSPRPACPLKTRDKSAVPVAGRGLGKPERAAWVPRSLIRSFGRQGKRIATA